MGCCLSRRIGSDDGELYELPTSDVQLYMQLEEMALSASSADTADEPFPCTAGLRERLIVFRASMRHNINGDPLQFAEFAKAQEPELLPRDQRRAGQWVDDVLRHAATAAAGGAIVCPVSAYDTWKIAKRQGGGGGGRGSGQHYAVNTTAVPEGDNATNNTAATDADSYAGGDGDGGTATPSSACTSMATYAALATRHAARLQRAYDEEQELLQQQQQLQQPAARHRSNHQQQATADRQSRPSPNKLRPFPATTPGGGSGTPGAASGNSRGVAVDSRGVFVSQSDHSDSGAAATVSGGEIDLLRYTNQAHASPTLTAAGSTPPNSGGRRAAQQLLLQQAPRSQQAQPALAAPSYARRMLLQHAGGFRGPRALGPRGGRPPPARALAEQQVTFSYSESSDPDDASDGDLSPATVADLAGHHNPPQHQQQQQQQQHQRHTRRRNGADDRR